MFHSYSDGNYSDFQTSRHIYTLPYACNADRFNYVRIHIPVCTCTALVDNESLTMESSSSSGSAHTGDR